MQSDEKTSLLAKFRSIFSAPSKEPSPVAVDTVNEVSPDKDAGQSEIATEAENRNTWSREESVTAREIGLRTVAVTPPKITLPAAKDLDIRFARNFTSLGGKFIYCQNIREAVSVLNLLKFEHNWHHIFAWENEIKDAFAEYHFQRGAIGFTIENSDAAISLAECLIADEGAILLNPKQASRRRLPCFPKTHLILTDIAHLAATEAEALERFNLQYKGELPSIIKLGCHAAKGNLYDKQRLILNADGPDDVYVLLVDEIIPPSLRP
ncbi:MAG: lactate utilization protein [Chitinophagales bacterium]|nr:lactate utilization protein [Chitinophagales bacterium]MDW8418548.1 LUD domain-containing protein [Chitinophagales bacterium]